MAALQSLFAFIDTMQLRFVTVFAYNNTKLFSPVTAKGDGFHSKVPRKFIYATPCIFGISKRLQPHDSVHLLSDYTDYSFSSYNRVLKITEQECRLTVVNEHTHNAYS